MTVAWTARVDPLAEAEAQLWNLPIAPKLESRRLIMVSASAMQAAQADMRALLVNTLSSRQYVLEDRANFPAEAERIIRRGEMAEPLHDLEDDARITACNFLWPAFGMSQAGVVASCEEVDQRLSRI